MRLDRLDLTRYGRFTDHILDFGEPEAGRPDLHIVYGPNEAGKSTTLSAFLDLLFGIETRSGYDFLHPYATMRIGAALRLDGGVRDFARIKRPQNSLLDHNDQPVAGAAILAELGGIDRDAYRTMFSLDDETLEAGGESILASKGDLGQLLFSASAGLADLSHGLTDLEAEAQRFYKFKARSGILSALKKRLADLKTERERIDTLASDYARLIQDRDGAAALYDDAIAERGRNQARIEEIGRLLSALPRLAALRGLRERLAPYAGLPEVPREWAGELPRLQTAEIELGVGIDAITQDIEERSTLLQSLVIDDAALAQADRVNGLSTLRPRHVTADKDLPERRQRSREADGEISSLLRRIEREGEAEPGRLILGASITGRLRELIEARSGIDTAVKAAHVEWVGAEQRLVEARSTLDAAKAGDEIGRTSASAMASLRAALTSVRGQDFAARRRLAERSGEIASAKLMERLRALRPWQGEGEDLADLRVPPAAAIARWNTMIAEARKDIERHANQAENLTTELRRLNAERHTIGAVTGLVGDQEAALVRATRDQAWAEHRRRLDATSADAFETTLRRDDAVAQGRFGHMADLAKLHQVAQAIAIAQAQCERATELRDAATAAQRTIEMEISHAIRTVAPALDGMPLPQFETWLTDRDLALQARDAVRTAKQDRRDADSDAASAREVLAKAMAEAGLPQDPETGIDTLLVTAQDRLDRETVLQTQRDALEDRRREVASRERERAEVAARDRDWAEAWAEICQACWLGEGGRVPTLATMREILPVLADLGPALTRRDSLADRIAKMDNDQAAFRDEVIAIAGDMGITDTKGLVLDLSRTMDQRVEKARADRASRDDEARKIEGLRERQRALGEALAVHRRQVEAMTAHCGVETLAEVARCLADIEKRADLQRQADEAEHDVLVTLRVPTLAIADDALAATDPLVLETELAGLKIRFDNLDQRCHELFSTHSKAVDRVEAIGGDATVAEIEERRWTTLLEIEEGARRYFKLRAGTAATEWALRAYRDRHRSSMLESASRAFKTISRGAYTGLAAQPEKDGEALIALAAGGGSKQAAELSKGTRFQLYLALRVAGYHEFAKTRRPVPFIADDIMETFDDFRAEEALRLFAGMAEVGQVIYLTHHRHLCEIAKSIAPGVRIHEIAATST